MINAYLFFYSLKLFFFLIILWRIYYTFNLIKKKYDRMYIIDRTFYFSSKRKIMLKHSNLWGVFENINLLSLFLRLHTLLQGFFLFSIIWRLLISYIIHMFALQKLAIDISNIRLFQSYRGIKHVDVLYKEWTQIENNCQKKLIAHVLWSLPYT